MAVVLDLISASLKEIGVLAAGEVPTAGDSLDALDTLNRLVDQWAVERLQIYSITRATWTITSGTYSVAGTATVPRPNRLNSVAFIDTSTNPDTEYPLGEMTDDAYAGITLKAQTGVFPQSWYYNPTFPSGTLTIWPEPTSSTLTGVMYVPAPVGRFAGLTTAISLPPGYERMIVKNLALELAPTYEREVTATLARQAMDSRAVVKASNKRLTDLSFDAFTGHGGWDIHTGP